MLMTWVPTGLLGPFSNRSLVGPLEYFELEEGCLIVEAQVREWLADVPKEEAEDLVELAAIAEDEGNDSGCMRRWE
jgi:hypothetical protein